MNSLRNFVLAGVVGYSLIACGSDDSSAAGGSGGASGAAGGAQAGSSSAGTSGGSSTTDPTDCEAVGAQQKARITALGCADTSADIENGCKALYAARACTSEWEALIECITPKSNSDFECDDDDELAPKTGVCTAERAAFDGCLDD